MQIQELVQQTNIAENLDEDRLTEIGHSVVEGYNDDKQSRWQWEKKAKEYYDLALQVAKWMKGCDPTQTIGMLA